MHSFGADYFRVLFKVKRDVKLQLTNYLSSSKPSDHVMLRLPCRNSVFQALKGTSPFEEPFSRWTHC